MKVIPGGQTSESATDRHPRRTRWPDDGAGQRRKHRTNEGTAISDRLNVDRDFAIPSEHIHRVLNPLDRYGASVRRLCGCHDAIRRRGRWPDEEWFYLAGPGPTRFVKVVVHYEHGEGRIVTAFPRRAFP